MQSDEEIRAEIERLRAENESLKRRRQRSSPISAKKVAPANVVRNSAAGQPLDLMIEALGLEIAAIRKKGGSKSVDLVGGALMSASNGSYVYRFPLTDDPQLRDETPVRVQFGQLEVSGSIVSVGDGSIVLDLEEDLGQRLPRVRLTADDSFLIERLKNRLQQIKSREMRFNIDAALRIIGGAPINVVETTVPASALTGTNLNAEQTKAVKISQASDVLFLWGPPGTGKTFVLARIVKAHYQAGRSVLVVSNTNIAVDTALKKIAEELENETGFQSGAVIRHGEIVDNDLKTRFGSRVILTQVVDRCSRSFQEKLGSLLSEKTRHAHSLQDLRLAIKTHNAVATVVAEIKLEKESLRALEAKVRGWAGEIELQSIALKDLKRDLDRANGLGPIRRLLFGLHPQRLHQKIEHAESLAVAKMRDRLAAEEDRVRQAAKVNHLEGQLPALSGLAAGFHPMDRCRIEVTAARARIKELDPLIAELQKKIEQVRQEVLNRCRVLAMTVYKTYLTGQKGQLERQFDVVIVDEASMLMLPMSFYAAGLARRTVVVAGDFRQLPPIVLSNEPLAENWLKEDAFFRIGIPEQVKKGVFAPYGCA